MEAATIVDTAGSAVDLDALRDDMSSGQSEIEVDDEGRKYHVHDDGAVHYVDED
jgi:hypothetical protein